MKPRAIPDIREREWNCSAIAEAATALQPPATTASTSAPTRAKPVLPALMSWNIVSEVTTARIPNTRNSGRLPQRSAARPASGVTAMTATAAAVASSSEFSSPNLPTCVRNVGA